MIKNFSISVIVLFVIFSFSVQKVFALVLPQYVETKVVGGTNLDWGQSVKVDSNGNVYVLGGFFSDTIDFDSGEGIDNISNVGSVDIFLTKYDAGGLYEWTKTWGSLSNDGPYSMAFDSDNNVYLATEFSGTIDFDPGDGVDNHTSAGNIDIALIKLNADGSYAWVEVIGSINEDRLMTVQIALDGEIYIGGKFRGTVDFNSGVDVDEKTSLGDYDSFFYQIKC